MWTFVICLAKKFRFPFRRLSSPRTVLVMNCCCLACLYVYIYKNQVKCDKEPNETPEGKSEWQRDVVYGDIGICIQKYICRITVKFQLQHIRLLLLPDDLSSVSFHPTNRMKNSFCSSLFRPTCPQIPCKLFRKVF